MQYKTIDEPAQFPKDYLKGVEDPISTECDYVYVGNNQFGMSQKGAIRWSKGNQCAGSGNQPWSVAWDGDNGYKQILAHYYTGIDILGGSGEKIAPDYRWNLLKYNSLAVNATGGYDIRIQLQNTSTTDWELNKIILGYQWTARDAPFVQGAWKQLTYLSEGINKGMPLEMPPPSIPTELGGNVTLHLDLQYQDNNGQWHWFSEQTPNAWPDATIDIDNVTGPTATPTATAESPTPTLSLSTPILISTSTSTPTFTPAPVLFKSLEFVDWNLNIWTGTGGYQPCTTYPYISCSATVTNTQTNPDRLDFDITYNYNDNHSIFGSDFWIDIRFKTNVFNTDVPIYWKISGDAMPTRWITTQYSGTADYGSKTSPITGLKGNWVIPSQPYSYDKSTFHFVRTTGGPDKLVRTDTWQFAIATYNINCKFSEWKHWIQQYQSTRQMSSENGFAFAISNSDRITSQAAMLTRLEEEILSTTIAGQRYVDLYYTHGFEIAAILNNNPDLADQGLDVIDALTPNLQALLDGQGGSATITNAQVQQAQAFLDAILPYASLQLQQAIADERASHPLEQLNGITMSQAWAYLNNEQIPTAIPTPTLSPTPTITNTPTTTPFPTFTPTAQTPVSIDIPIASNSDDAEESASGSVSLSSSDLELIRDADNQQVGLRFTNVTIPQGTTILNAYIQFTVDETTSEATTLTLQGEANDNPVTFGYSTSNKISTRPPTTSSVAWNPSAWLTLNESGTNQRTTDLTLIIQEIVNRSGWNSGNALAILMTGTGKRVAVAYEGGANSAPRLHVEYTTSSAATATPAPTNTPTNTPIPGVVFSDGFESGDLSAWSSSSTDGGDLFASAQAAAVGSYGMEALIDDTMDIDVTDVSPNNETHYSARFYLNPNSVNLPNNESMYVFTGSDDAYNWKLCLGMRRMAEYYALTLCGQNDANAWFEGRSAYITDDWQAVEIEWQAASAVGTNDGFAKLWINDVLVDTLGGLDTDASRISRISLGATDSIPAGASGSVYFDAFESRQGDPIGLDPSGPALSAPLIDLVFKDDFESNGFSLWGSTTLGGDLSVSSPSAIFGSYGMQALINDTVSINAADTSPADEAQYHARFYLDPNSISIPNNNGFSIFSAGGDAGSVFRVTLNNSGGSYTLQTQAYHDAGGMVSGQPIVITDEPQMIEIAFQAANASGANDGYLELWVNDVLVNTIANLDNDTRLVDHVNLGATSGVDAGTSGTLYFDQFEARRNTHIGYYP
ncbi:MAG: hypothetical protein AABZ00_11640 [Chloroflexota bacterium]